MRVFLTGATGFVGSAVADDLRRAGHQVLGLARTAEAARALAANGVEPHRGDLTDLASLSSGVEASDGVIHTGFLHDFSRFKECCAIDRRAIEVMGEALGSRPLVVTSAVGVLPAGQLATEDSRPPSPNWNPRVSEETAAELLAKNLNVSIVRLPPSTHGAGDRGFVYSLMQIARDQGASVYIDEGQNRWPAVHRADAARVYVGALEKATPGGHYHAVAEDGVPFKLIAECIGRGLRLPIISKPAAQAAAHFTWFAHFAAMNVTASSERTKETLGWQPARPGLIEDMRQTYF